MELGTMERAQQELVDGRSSSSSPISLSSSNPMAQMTFPYLTPPQIHLPKHQPPKSFISKQL